MRHRLLMFLTLVLLALSFIASMLWISGRHVSEVRFKLRSTKVGFLIDDHFTAYLVPEDHWQCETHECKYGPFRNDSIGAVNVPMWIIAGVMAVWPIWWLLRHGRLRMRTQSAALAQRRESVPRLVLSAIVLSHMLASYAAFILGGLVDDYWYWRGMPLAAAPLVMVTEFPSDTRFVFTREGHWALTKLLAVGCWAIYLVGFGIGIRLLLILPLRQGLRARRAARGMCPTCGYDLRATPNRCPECGHEFSPQTKSPERMPGAAIVG